MAQPAQSIKPDRFVIGLALVAALLVIVGFVSVLVVQRQPVPTPDLATPDGTVLAYLQAYRTGSDSAVRSFYSQRILQQISQANPPGIPKPFPGRVPPTSSSQRVQVVDTKVDGDRATVTLSITTFRVDSPVTPSEYTYQSSVPLVRENGQWKLDEEFYPG